MAGLYNENNDYSPLPALTSLHLPDCDHAVLGLHQHEVIQRPPFDQFDGVQVARRQQETFPLLQTQESHGMVARHRADTGQDTWLKTQ